MRRVRARAHTHTHARACSLGSNIYTRKHTHAPCHLHVHLHSPCLVFFCFYADRKRWVLYKDTFSYNASSIPPEWHGWINYINDAPPTTHEYITPMYAVQHYANRTGTKQAYAPKVCVCVRGGGGYTSA